MATPLQFADAAIGSEVALPSEVDVRGPTQCGEAKADAADSEPSRTQLRRWNLKMRHDYDAEQWLRRDTRSANRSTARETSAPGTGCSRRRSATCAGLGPALAVSHLSRATRRSQGSLPQHMPRRSSIGTQRDAHGAWRGRHRINVTCRLTLTHYSMSEAPAPAGSWE